MTMARLLVAIATIFAMPGPGVAGPVGISEAQLQAPMVFALVRGRSVVCEPTCPEWISAQGTITNASPAALKALLDTIGERKLPMIISSVGGSIDAALEMGAIIREAKLPTVVGRTSSWVCAPADPDCRPAQGLFRGQASSIGLCMSACTIMFAGGVERRATGSAKVGVHMPYKMELTVRNVYKRRFKIVDGKRVFYKQKRLTKRIITDTMTPVSQPELNDIADFFARMEVSPAIIDLFKSTPPQDMRILVQDEVRSYGLVSHAGGVETLISPSRCLGAQLAANCVKRDNAEVSPL